LLTPRCSFRNMSSQRAVSSLRNTSALIEDDLIAAALAAWGAALTERDRTGHYHRRSECRQGYCKLIARFEGVDGIYCPRCSDKFKADFNGHKVVCAFCSSRVLKKELPTIPTI
jgi:DNA-directed RNA polymerase subunit RPC12/RpoP